jgi:CheY-like chemotaxis protein
MSTEVLFMPNLMDQRRTPSEFGDSDAYNLAEVTRTARARRDPIIEAHFDAAQRRLRVLIVDDHRAFADTMSKLVSIWGHDVRQAYNGAAGLALAVRFWPDVMLLDLNMPGMSGPEFALQVRRRARLKNCRMIAITGYTDERHRLQCQQAGVELILIKPIGPSILQSLLTTESEHRPWSRRTEKTFAATATTVEPWTGANSNGRTRTAQDIVPAATAT